jgi:FAD-dependent urate hydroxylase
MRRSRGSVEVWDSLSGDAMTLRTDLLVIGAGPYAYAAAAFARDHGIDTHMVGRPMSFWREQMPAGMYLR